MAEQYGRDCNQMKKKTILITIIGLLLLVLPLMAEAEIGSNNPVLTVSISTDRADYGDVVSISASIEYPDGSTEGLIDLYPDASISATLFTNDGEVVPSFIVQTTYALKGSFNFPLADEEMPAGYYKVVVESTVENLVNETEPFYYTADKSHIPDPSECRISISLSSTELILNELFSVTATVTDKDNNPVNGIKVGFQILDSERNITDFYDYDYLWNITREAGTCSIRSRMTSLDIDSFPPGKYIARVFIDDVDTDISDEQVFEHKVNVLYLPASLKAIEEEAFSALDCQAVIIPEGCETIGEGAFRNCPDLVYVMIPNSITSYPENAFEGCNENLVIDWRKDD